MKKYYIFLDDTRKPINVKWVKIPNYPWTIVRSYNDFVTYIKSMQSVPGFICYDHDLADDHYKNIFDVYKKNGNINYEKYKEKTGYDCAKWMINYCAEHKIPHPSYVVHSMNPVGKENIINLIESYNKNYYT